MSGLGASEAAAALGLSPYESPRGIYLRKLGEAPEKEETEAMRWGLLLEPVILAEYEARTGNRVVSRQVFLGEEGVDGQPDLFATLDGLTETQIPVEVKTISAWAARDIGDEAEDDLPDHWLLQAQQQMWLADAPSVDFAILIGGQRLEIRPVARNDELIATMRQGLFQFWEYVVRREPPPEIHVADRKLMHLIYPGCEGEIDLSAADAAIVDRYQELGPVIKDSEELRNRYKASLLERLGSNAIGHLPDGRVLTRKIISVEEQCITRKAYSFVDLRIKKGSSNGKR
jgi:putative phage-type endonuclease